jgi:arylsulfatase A-like enzyme
MRRFDVAFGAVICSLLLAAASLSASAAEKPNIVLVMADDQGWGDMAYNGHPHLITPHFDALSREGIRFDHFYAAAPVCSPTRASVMSGRNPIRTGTFSWGFSLRPEEVTIAELLKPAGYRTGHFGKWHLGSVRKGSEVSPGAQGFDVWLSGENFFDIDPILSREGTAVQLHGEGSELPVDAALKFIGESVKQEKPFLAVVWFGNPHSPHQATAKDREHYTSLPPKLQNFYGEITAMDRAFGRLRKGLADLGIRDNTVLWYCSDNGGLPGVGTTGGRGNKDHVYEGGLRVPSLLEWPARYSKPKTVNVPCVTSDILPTVCAIAGVSPPNVPLDGQNLLPVLDGKATSRAKGIGFWRHPTSGIGTPNAKLMADLLAAQKAGHEPDEPEKLRADRAYVGRQWPDSERVGHAAWLEWPWKLHRIEGNRGGGKKAKQTAVGVRYELYNLQDDPLEEHDLAEQESSRVAAMREKLEQWQQSVVNSLNGRDYAAASGQ